jgi:RES domain-containing protein
MHIWRLSKRKYTTLDGEGARIYGGRWNSAGRPVIYTASSLSLALFEQFVRIDPGNIPDDFVSSKIEIPDDLPTEGIEYSKFPDSWREPEKFQWFRFQGDSWLEQLKTAVLIVPSVVIPLENNILINPIHTDAKNINIIEINNFVFDLRLFQQ